MAHDETPLSPALLANLQIESRLKSVTFPFFQQTQAIPDLERLLETLPRSAFIFSDES